MSRTKRGPTPSTTSEEALTSESWETRYLALKRLALDPKQPLGRRTEWLLRAAQDEHRACRLLAATGLADLAGHGEAEKVTAALVPLLDDTDAWVRLRAAQALGMAPHSKPAVALARRLRHEPDLKVRATLVKALGKLADPAQYDLVAALLSDPDARVRANAIEGLSAYDSPATAELLLPYLEDPAPRVRANAARVLVKYNRQRALHAFRALARSVDARGRASAAYGLGEIDERPSRDLLIELAQDPASTVRTQAIQSLARHGKSAEPGLLSLLASPDAEVRAAACNGLARVGTRASWSRLVELLEDADGGVREASALALEAVERRLSMNST